MKGLTLYRTYMAMNLTVLGKYNGAKYNFKTSASAEKFKSNKFRWQFSKCEQLIEASGHRLEFVVLAHFALSEFQYYRTPYAFFSRFKGGVDKILDDFKSELKKDLNHLSKKYNASPDLFNCEGLLYPHLYSEFMRQDISLSTVILLDSYVFPGINTFVSKDIIAWPQFLTEFNRVKDIVLPLYPRSEYEQLFSSEYLKTQVV